MIRCPANGGSNLLTASSCASFSRGAEVAPSIARLNAAEPTEPLDRSVEQRVGRPADEAPVVMTLEEIFKPVWLKRLNSWMRRLRRCMKLVATGNWRKARRMRPADLWVSAEASMLPGVAEWDWDLRGLAEGRPAVPIARSKFPDSPPRSSLHLDQFMAAHVEAGGAFLDHRIDAADIVDRRLGQGLLAIAGRECLAEAAEQRQPGLFALGFDQRILQ